MDNLIGVKFDWNHSYTVYNLILTSKTIGSPQPKTEFVEVPGAPAPLDFTEFFGDVQYNNRTLTFNFTVSPAADPWEVWETVQNAMNGRRVKIQLDEDQNYYFFGRVSVGDLEKEKNIYNMKITADCEPYKYKNAVTEVTKSVSGTVTVTCTNDRMHVVPTFESEASLTIKFDNNTYQATSTGQFTIPEIVFVQGENQLQITGSGNVKIRYQEGAL